MASLWKHSFFSFILKAYTKIENSVPQIQKILIIIDFHCMETI